MQLRSFLNPWDRWPLVWFLALAGSAGASTRSAGSVPASTPAALALEASSSWRVERAEDGSALLVPRDGARPASAPRTQGDLLAIADQVLREASALLALDSRDLTRQRVTFLPLGLIGSTDKLAVRYQQQRAGIPVEGGLSVLLDARGRALAVTSSAARAADLAEVAPRRAGAAAPRVALAEFEALTGAVGAPSAPPSLLFARDPEQPDRAHELVWSVLVRSSPGAPARQVYELRVPACGPGRVRALDRLLRYDVTGTVAGWISPGVLPDDLNHGAIASSACSPCDPSTCGACPPTACAVPACGPDCSPEVTALLSDLEIADSHGNRVWTGPDGSFRLPGSAPVDVTLRFRGRYAQVVDAQGADFVLTTTLAHEQGNRILLGGPAPYGGGQQLTAQANAYHWLTRLRHWIADVNPLDATWDLDPHPKLARVNLPATVIGCDGEFRLPPAAPTVSGGPEVLFSIGGGPCGTGQQPVAGCGCCGVYAGDCTNKSNATVLLHETGHWLNHLYLGLSAVSAFNEGLADTWSMYVSGDPRLFPFACTAETCLRSGENCRQYAGYGDQFVGDPHRKGEVLMGSLWQVRARLVAVHGQRVGAATASALFLAWITACDEFAIHGGIKRRWLILDDDDGNPLTPAPHQAAILSGFESHGL